MPTSKSVPTALLCHQPVVGRDHRTTFLSRNRVSFRPALETQLTATKLDSVYKKYGAIKCMFASFVTRQSFQNKLARLQKWSLSRLLEYQPQKGQVGPSKASSHTERAEKPRNPLAAERYEERRRFGGDSDAVLHLPRLQEEVIAG